MAKATLSNNAKTPATIKGDAKAFFKNHKKVSIGVGATLLAVLVGVFVWIGVKTHQKNKADENIGKLGDQITEIGGENDKLKDENGGLKDQVDNLQQDIKDKDDIINSLQNKQEVVINGSPEELQAQFGDYMQGKGGRLQSFHSFRCDGNDLTLFFNGKAANGKTDTVVAFSMKAEAKSFETKEVLAWLKNQAQSENEKDHPQVSVFTSAQDLGIKSETMNAMLNQLSEKKIQLAQKDLNANISIDGGNPTVTVADVDKGKTLFAVEKSEMPDSKGNYKVSVKGLSVGADGKYVIDEVGEQLSVDAYAEHNDIVTAAVKKYCEKYGVVEQVSEEGLEA